MDGLENEWDSYAETWDSDEYVRAYAAAAFESLRELISSFGIDLAAARVLDFGCGSGLLTERLVTAGADVVAVDTSTAMLAVVEAKIAQRGWIGVRTSTSLIKDDDGFDLVACSSVCAFLDDYSGTAEELVGCLRPGGLFVQWDWERSGDEPGGLTRSEIKSALEGAGLIEVVVKDAFAVEVNGMTMAPIMGYGRAV